MVVEVTIEFVSSLRAIRNWQMEPLQERTITDARRNWRDVPACLCPEFDPILLPRCPYWDRDCQYRYHTCSLHWKIFHTRVACSVQCAEYGATKGRGLNMAINLKLWGRRWTEQRDALKRNNIFGQRKDKAINVGEKMLTCCWAWDGHRVPI